MIQDGYAVENADSTLERSVKNYARAMPGFQTWDGVATFAGAAPLDPRARAGDILLFAAAHLNGGARKLRHNPETQFHPNLTSAIELKFKGREYTLTMPWDVAQYVCERSNSLQDLGVGTTWISKIRKMVKIIFPSWSIYKNTPDYKLAATNMPESGPGSYHVHRDIEGTFPR